MACLYRKEACYQQQYYGGGVVSGPLLGWAVSSALSVALRIQTLHPAACWTSKHGSWMQMEVRLQTPTVRGSQHFADWIAEFRGILKMVPSSSQSLPKGSYRAPSPWVQSCSRAESSSWWGNWCSCTGRQRLPGRWRLSPRQARSLWPWGQFPQDSMLEWRGQIPVSWRPGLRGTDVASSLEFKSLYHM